MVDVVEVELDEVELDVGGSVVVVSATVEVVVVLAAMVGVVDVAAATVTMMRGAGVLAAVDVVCSTVVGTAEVDVGSAVVDVVRTTELASTTAGFDVEPWFGAALVTGGGRVIMMKATIASSAPNIPSPNFTGRVKRFRSQIIAAATYRFAEVLGAGTAQEIESSLGR